MPLIKCLNQLCCSPPTRDHSPTVIWPDPASGQPLGSVCGRKDIKPVFAVTIQPCGGGPYIAAHIRSPSFLLARPSCRRRNACRDLCSIGLQAALTKLARSYLKRLSSPSRSLGYLGRDSTSLVQPVARAWDGQSWQPVPGKTANNVPSFDKVARPASKAFS